jgi:hypothetical protein
MLPVGLGIPSENASARTYRCQGVAEVVAEHRNELLSEFRGCPLVGKAQRSPAVMCAAFLCGRRWTAGLDGFRESRPYQLVGI